jgi:hypothetical protein
MLTPEQQFPSDMARSLLVGRHRAVYFIRNHLNRSLAIEAQSSGLVKALHIVQKETRWVEGSHIVCYPIRISNFTAPQSFGHHPSPALVLRWFLTDGDQSPDQQRVIIASIQPEGDGTFTLDLGYRYAEDALNYWTQSGSLLNGRPIFVEPVRAVVAGERSWIFPGAVIEEPLTIQQRLDILADGLGREDAIERVANELEMQEFTLASCHDTMRNLRTELTQLTQGTETTLESISPGGIEHCDLGHLQPPPVSSAWLQEATEPSTWSRRQLSGFKEYQAKWPLYLVKDIPGVSAQESITKPGSSKVPRPRPVAQPDTLLQASGAMQFGLVRRSRRAVRHRAELMFDAWHSDRLPLPTLPRKIPVDADIPKMTPEEKEAWTDPVMNAQSTMRVRVAAPPEEHDLDFLTVWGWYNSSGIVIDMLYAQLPPSNLTWPAPSEDVDSEMLALIVRNESYTMLRGQFSKPRRLPGLGGLELERVLQKANLLNVVQNVEAEDPEPNMENDFDDEMERT